MSALEKLNAAPPDDAAAMLLACCGSRRWAEAMSKSRPFASAEQLYAEAERAWATTGPEDWLEAFSCHPRIGATAAGWSKEEQKGVSGAPEEALQALAEGNRAYEARFGFTFIVCATGKSTREMLELLRARLSSSREEELRVAAGEQAKITRIRLEKLFSP